MLCEIFFLYLLLFFSFFILFFFCSFSRIVGIPAPAAHSASFHKGASIFPEISRHDFLFSFFLSLVLSFFFFSIHFLFFLPLLHVLSLWIHSRTNQINFWRLHKLLLKICLHLTDAHRPLSIVHLSIKLLAASELSWISIIANHLLHTSYCTSCPSNFWFLSPSKPKKHLLSTRITALADPYNYPCSTASDCSVVLIGRISGLVTSYASS